MKIKAVILDFDGVIVSSKVAEYDCWKKIFKVFGCDLDMRKWIKIIDNPAGVFDPATIIENECKFKDKEHKIDLEAIRVMRYNLYEYVVERLGSFSGITSFLKDYSQRGLIGLASNGTHAKSAYYLKKLRLLKYFNCIKCRDDVKNRKPAPDVYQAVLKEFQIEPHEAIAIEDSPPGITAAKAAGLYCIAIPNRITKFLDLSEADETVSSIKKVSENW